MKSPLCDWRIHDRKKYDISKVDHTLYQDVTHFFYPLCHALGHFRLGDLENVSDMR